MGEDASTDGAEGPESVGTIHQQAGVREEKWPNLDLKHLKFPQATAHSVKRATALQQFEADFVRN